MTCLCWLLFGTYLVISRWVSRYTKSWFAHVKWVWGVVNHVFVKQLYMFFSAGNTYQYLFFHLFAILSPLTLFLWNFDHGWSRLTGSDKPFGKNIFFIPCPVFDVWRHLCASFCHFSAIFKVNPRFSHYNLIFKHCLSW